MFKCQHILNMFSFSTLYSAKIRGRIWTSW